MADFIKKQLMCRFSDSKTYVKDVDHISKNCKLTDRRIFILSNANNSNEIFLTFNIQKNILNKIKYMNTISIHRKNHTNTLYTLNAMNRLIEDENCGVFDKTFQLDWELYKNSIILINDPGVKIISLKLISTVNL